MTRSCLIVGLGQIGLGYDLEVDPGKAIYTHARAFALHPAFELSGAVDPFLSKRILFERHYQKPSFPELEAALHSARADVVVIASPTAMHQEVLEKVLLHAKPDAILCEKPLAYDPLAAHRMVEACDNAGVQLFVNYMRRADPGVIEVKRRIESGAITLPVKGTAWYSKGFLHNGSHFFNLLEFWLGPFVRARILDKGRTCSDQDSEPDVQVEFEHGSVILLAAWEEAFSHYTIELMSPSGRLRYEQGGEYITWHPPHADPGFSGYKTLQAVPILIDNDMSRYQWHVADQLANALDGKPYSLCTGRQALTTLEAMHQIVNQKQS